MKPVNVSVEIDRPVEDVFAFLSDYENNPRFMGGIVSATWTSERTYDQVATMLGRRIESKFDLVVREPPTRLRVESTAGPFPIQETRAMTDLGGGRTRVDVTVEGGPTGAGRCFEPVMRAMVKRSVGGDYRRLKALLEKG